ncbi:MAG TPA: peptidoglycan DD-metalloendopeptidase family protein [Gemmatimonadales bacterium]|jgi:murein DD-endopeptidase MepM/ murein hydrolase activator NlpD|nr:peptidoglycan DD-metalloendopeptidase family protein [Gemmatimonadales bacterium]
MSQPRFVRIVIHRDGDVESRSLRLPLWAVRATLIATGTIATLVLVGAVLYAPIVRTAARVPGLQRTVARLEQENAQVRQLARTLNEVEARYAQVRAMLGGNIVPPQTRTPSERLPTAYALYAGSPGTQARYETGASVPSHWPLDEAGVITRGQVRAGSGDESHPGMDIAVPMDTPIRAAGGGLVAQTGFDPEYGLFAIINHPDGYQTLYGHASRIVVHAGDSVEAGQVIGLSGSTGRSTGPHLHFEIRRDGKSIDPRTLVKEGS